MRLSAGWMMTFGTERGMIHLKSALSVEQTLLRLKDVLQARGIPVLAEIDHTSAAAKVGLTMLPTTLLIFGDARAGTPAMVASPTLALDLPLKALVWQDAEGQVWLSYNDPAYLQERHGVPAGLMPKLAGIRVIAEEAVR